MKLTGKCKDDFEKWYDGFTSDCQNYKEWDSWFPLNMQYGVYVDFFDSKEFNISTHVRVFSIQWSCFVSDGFKSGYYDKGRGYTRLKAIEKANEIYNSK